MKKFLSTIIAVAMLGTMSTVAFAADITANNGTDEKDVKATYVASEADTVYNVDVVWDSMEFTYTEASEGTWDPDTHAYDGATTDGTWTGDGTIVVTNHSNTAITVKFEYTEDDADITGEFDKASFELATAEDTDVAAAPTNSAELTLSGELADTYTTSSKVGSVKVTISQKSGGIEPTKPGSSWGNDGRG